MRGKDSSLYQALRVVPPCTHTVENNPDYIRKEAHASRERKNRLCIQRWLPLTGHFLRQKRPTKLEILCWIRRRPRCTPNPSYFHSVSVSVSFARLFGKPERRRWSAGIEFASSLCRLRICFTIQIPGRKQRVAQIRGVPFRCLGITRHRHRIRV